MKLMTYVKQNQLLVMGGVIVILVNLIGGLWYFGYKPKNNNTINIVPAETPTPTALQSGGQATVRPTPTPTALQSGGQATVRPTPTPLLHLPKPQPQQKQ